MDNNQITNAANNSELAVTEQQSFLEAMNKSDSKSLKGMSVMMDLTAEYLELAKPTESFRGVYIGIQEMNVADKQTGEMKTLPAARFLIDKKIYINAGAVLISEIQRANVPFGTPLEVTYLKKDGNTKIYTIKLIA